MVDLLCRWLFVLLMVRHSVHLDLSPCYFLMAWLLFRLFFCLISVLLLNNLDLFK